MLLRLTCVQAALVSASQAAPRKLKVLGLHGYAQNSAVLRDRSGGFRKPLKKSRFELQYIDAPYGCTANGEPEAEADADLMRRAWWCGSSRQETYRGWYESCRALSAIWERERFDGVFGFSQGAAAAAMLCAEMRPKPKFAILVSGFVPRDHEAAAELLAGISGVSSLHVLGKADEIVVPSRSRALAKLFSDAVIVEHEGGHMIPSGASVRQHVATFVDGLSCNQY
mmetsp:Transcript_52571/g.87241  ORF Transcript_52571/g.87241 Transcript_52571/m.87241 type:complete len:226 (-) Transcript_52571:111-788(-)